MNISDFKSRLSQKIHGQNLNKVQDVDGLIYEAAGNLLNEVDPKETIRHVAVTNGLYDQVYSYAVPADLKKDRIINIERQAGSTEADRFVNNTYKEFDTYKDNDTFVVDYNSLTKTLKLSKSVTDGLTVHTADSVTDNGTWVASGDASGLVADTVNKVSGSGSLRFNLAASGSSGVLTNSDFTDVDLSIYTAYGSLFAYVYLPDGSDFTSVTLTIGNDASNYYSMSATTTHEGTSFIDGYNLLRFDFSGATETGSVDDTAIDYITVTFAYNGNAQSAVRLDNIVARLPIPFDLVYYSSYLFRDTSGTWLEKPTAIDDSDIINLEIDGLNLLLYEAARLVAQELAGEDSALDLAFWERERDRVYKTYKAQNKSAKMKQRTTYYRLSRRS